MSPQEKEALERIRGLLNAAITIAKKKRYRQAEMVVALGILDNEILSKKFKIGDRILAYEDNSPGEIIGWNDTYQAWRIRLDDGTVTVTDEENLILDRK